MTDRVRLGGRGSELSRVQAQLATDAMSRVGIESEFIAIRTEGDRDRRSLRTIGGQGLFVRAVEESLLNGEIDIAVHSAKDMPPQLDDSAPIVAYLPRGDVRDALVSRDHLDLFQLAPAARIGTGSRRRAAQLRRLRPDVEVVDIRGNVDRRVARLSEGSYDAVVVAAIALQRLNRSASAILPIDLMMPSPGQGALALQCRANDVGRFRLLNHDSTSRAVAAERAMLRALGAGCSLPLAALAHVRGGEVLLAGRLLSVDGSERIDVQRSGDDPERVGVEVAERLLERGGQHLLDDASLDDGP